jgi:WhiB family redox-sensing transcriptional regulator
MTISVLDRPECAQTTEHSLGGLHQAAGRADDQDLPCRSNNPELWFAESPSDVEFAKALCQECPVRSLCLDGAPRPRGAVGCVGRRTVLARRRDPAQAPSRSSSQGRPLSQRRVISCGRLPSQVLKFLFLIERISTCPTTSPKSRREPRCVSVSARHATGVVATNWSWPGGWVARPKRPHNRPGWRWPGCDAESAPHACT